MKLAACAILMLWMVGCRKDERVKLTPIWPTIHELQDKVQKQQQEIDALKLEIEQGSNGSATATGDCSVADTGNGNSVTFNGEDGCPPKSQKRKEKP